MEYEWIDTWLGAPRFQRYVEQCEGNRGQALKLYEWNSLAGQTLMRDISHFEIALRNGYDKEISSSWEGEHHWLLDPHSPAITPVWRVREKNGVKRGQDVNQRNRKQVDDAISKCGNAKATAGQVMAELSFGFWRQFTTKAMEKTLWVPYINKCFPHHTQRSEVDKIIESVNSLRNRIAHNEPIYKRNGPDPFVIHNLMFGLLHDLSPEACKHAEVTSGVQEIKTQNLSVLNLSECLLSDGDSSTGKGQYPCLMDIYELQVESLLLYAPEQDIEEIQRLLQGRFSKLEPTLQLQRVTTVIPTHDYMRLKDYWVQQYGHDLEPVGYQLKQINFVFLADREQDQEALGMQIYAIVSEAVRPFGKIEYFSSFGDPDGEELADKE